MGSLPRFACLSGVAFGFSPTGLEGNFMKLSIIEKEPREKLLQQGIRVEIKNDGHHWTHAE